MDRSSPSSLALRPLGAGAFTKLLALIIAVVTLGYASHAAVASEFPINAKISKGRVVSSPPGLDCTANVNGSVTTCSTAYVAGDPTNVTLTFIPFEHVHRKAAFSHITSGVGQGLGYLESATLPLLGGINVEIIGWSMPKIQATTSGSGSGRITSSPAGVDCSTGGGSGCTAWFDWAPYDSDLFITLTAIPTGGVFAGWSGYCASGTQGTSGGNPTVRSYVLHASTCDARFDIAPILTVATSGVGTGTVVSSPTGIACASGSSAHCSRAFASGTGVTLQATPNQGYSFGSWSGACSGTNPTVTVSLSSDTTCTANFVQGPDPVISATVYGGGTITSTPSGISCPSGSCSTTITWDSSITLTAVASSGTTFIEWSGACSGTSTSVTLSGVRTNQSCAARFEPPKKLTVSLSGSGVGQVAASSGGLVCSSGSCTADYAYRETVTLTATPTSGSTFESWGGSCSGTGQTVSVTMLGDQTCTANFKSDQKRLTITLAGTGNGQVTSVPSKINCTNVPATSTCAATFDTGATVVLTAVPETPSTENPYDESRFDGWGGACSGTAPTASVTLSAAQTCTATFTKLKSGVTLTVTLTGAKSGTVISTPAGITCTPATLGRQCVARYAKDTAVSLDVTAESGGRFTGWSGACTGRTSPMPLTLTESKSCTANFSAGAIVPEVGSWWNAGESGRGYGIEVQYTNGDPKIFFGAFAYTPAGPPIWYISFLTPTDDGTGFSGPLTSYSGGQTLLGAYQAPAGPATMGIGSQPLTLSFTSPTAGTISFPPLTAFAAGSTVAITRFPVVSGGLSNPRAATPTLPQSGWWWGSAEPGRGIFFEAQADAAGNQVLFTLFFLYGADGTPRWYFGSTALVSSGTAWSATAMAFYECSGGQPLGSSTPEIADCTAVPGGNTVLQFSPAGDTATMTLSTGATVALQRFAF